MKPNATAGTAFQTKQIHVPKVFQQMKPIPQSLSNQQLREAEDKHAITFHIQQNDFALFTGNEYCRCQVIAVSYCYQLAKVLLNKEILTVSKNQVFQISSKEYFEQPLDSTAHLRKKDVFDIENYQQIQLNTLQAHQFKPQEQVQPDTYKDNIAYKLAIRYEGIFSSNEIDKVFYAGVNRFEKMSESEWYCLPGFEWIFTAQSVKVVDELWYYLSSQRFCGLSKLQEPITLAGLTQVQNFIIMDEKYGPCRHVMQLLYTYYQQFTAEALKNADIAGKIREMNEQFVEIIQLIKSDGERDLCLRLLSVFNFEAYEPSEQFWRFQMLYINTTRVIYCALLNQLLDVDIVKAHRMFNCQLLNFASVEHISMCEIINSWFELPHIIYDTSELEVMLPVGWKPGDPIQGALGEYLPGQKDGTAQRQETSNSAIQQDVRRKNLILLQFLRKLQFVEYEEEHYSRFPLQMDIIFKQDVLESNQQVIRTEPSIPEAIARFQQYLTNITKCMFVFDSTEFYEKCRELGYDYHAQLCAAVHELYPEQETMRESCLKQCTAPLQVIYEEYLTVNIERKMFELTSVLLLANDIIVDNFTLDEELHQIDEFYATGFIREIQQQTDRFEQNNLKMGEFVAGKKYNSVQVQEFYFLEYFQQVLTDTQMVKRANFSRLISIFEFQIRAKKAFTYLLQDQLYFYCFCVDTGQLDVFFNRFEIQCYESAQKNIMDILHKFSTAIIQNMRLLLDVIGAFETNPFKFRDLSMVETVMSRASFKQFFNNIFGYVLVILEQITKMFGVGIQDSQVINEAYQFMFKLYDYERAYGLRLSGQDAGTEFQFYKLPEIQELRTTQLSKFFQQIEQIRIEKVDEIFNIISAIHRFSCILHQKYCLLNSRKLSYQQYINDLNLVLIEKSSQIMGIIQQRLFDNFVAVQFDKQITLLFADAPYDPEHVFEEEFIVELQSYIRIPIVSQNFKDRPSRCRDELHLLLQRYEPFAKNPDATLFLLKCRQIQEFLKELIQLILVKDQWLQCLHISEEYVEEGTMYTMLLQYYKNVALVYNVFLQSTLTDLQFFYEQDYTVRGTNIDNLQLTLSLFMNAMMLFRNSQYGFKQFITTQSVVFSPKINILMDQVVESQLNNFRYYYLFISMANKNLSPQQFKLLSSQFNMNVQQSLLISGSDIIRSYKSYSSTLFDYCQLINAQLILSTSIYQHVRSIFLECCEIKLQQRASGIIEFEYSNLVTYLQNSKIVLQQYVLRYNEYHANLLQFIRDVEQVIHIMLDLYYGINVLQFLIKDLLIIKTRGNIIQVDFKQLEREVIQPEVNSLISKYKKEQNDANAADQTDNRDIKQTVTKVKAILQQRHQQEEEKSVDNINLLNVFEIVSVNDGCRFLKLFGEKFIKQNAPFMACAVYFKTPKNEGSKFSIRELYKLISELYEIHDRILSHPYSYLFDKYQKQSSQNIMADNILKQQYQIFKMEAHQFFQKPPHERFQEKLQAYQQHQTQMQLLENHAYDKDAVLLPMISNQVMYINAACTAPQFLLYSSFEDNIAAVLHADTYKFQALFNIDSLDIQDSPTRGRIIVSFSSHHEQFVLVRPCRVPVDFCECDASLRKYFKETIHYKIDNSRSFMAHQEYDLFLKEPYHIQLLVLANSQKEELLKLKAYMQEHSIKAERYIPIANRLLEFIGLDESERFSFEFQNKQLFITPYGLQCSFVWCGAPFPQEYRDMPSNTYTYVHDILRGFSLNKPVILQHVDQDATVVVAIMQTLQRFLCRSIMQVYLSDSTFSAQFDTLQRYLLSGYIVYVMNYQNIKQCYRYQVVEFVNQITQKFGYFANIYKAALNQNIVKSVIKQKAIQQKNKLLGVQQLVQEKEIILTLDDLKIQQVSISEAHSQLGYLVFDFPNIENEKKQQLFSQFQNYHEVQLRAADQLNEYAKVNPVLGNAYYNIYKIMRFFNARVQKLSLQQYQMIHSQIADISNPLSNVLILMDQTMKSHMVAFEQHDVHAPASEGFNNHSFRHQKQIVLNLQQNKQPSLKPKLQALMNDFQLIGNLFSQQMRLSKNEMHQVSNQVKYYCSLVGKMRYNIRTKKSFYNQYVAEFIYGRLNEKTQAFLQQCVHQFQVSIGIAYDIYYVSILLKRQAPILLGAVNYEYLRFILEVANKITGNDGAMYYIYSMDYLRRISLQNDTQYIIMVSSQAQADAYIEFLHTLNLESYRLNLVFINSSKAGAIYNTFFQYRMSCLGEIKDIIGFKLYLVQNIKLVAIEQLQQLYIGQMHEKCVDYAAKLYRIKLMNGTFSGFTVLIFQILCKLFSLGAKTDEYAHIRAIFDFFLVQFQVLQISRDEYQFSDAVSGFEADVKNPKFQNDIQQHESQGMTKSCLQTTKLINKQMLGDMGKRSFFEIQSFYANNAIPGRDQHQCFKYQFTQRFIERIVQFDTAYEFVDYIVGCVIVCMWNAFSLFAQFAQADVFITKRYTQFYDYLKNFDLEKYVSGFEGYYLAPVFKFLNYDSAKNGVNLNLTQQKYSITVQIIKKLMVQMSERLPEHYFVKQFCYLNLLQLEKTYQWQSYTFGKGILQNIGYQTFIKLNRQVIARNQSEDQVDAAQEEPANQSDAEQQVAQFMKLQQLQRNDPIGSQRDAVGFAKNVDQHLYLEQFELENMTQHQDIQPIFGKYNCIFFDDERTAMAVLIACSMLSMTTFQVDGCKSSGKTTLIKVAGLIVKDMVTIQQAVILDSQNECGVECFMQAVLDNYEVFNQRFVYHCTYQIDSDIDFDKDINVFANQTYMLLENQLFDSLKEFKFKHDDLEKIYRLLTNYKICHEQALFNSQNDKSTCTELHFRSLKCIYDQIQVFHIEYNPGQDNDRLKQLLEQHQILELGQRYQQLESNLINVEGTLQLIDTSFVIESDNGCQPFDIVRYKMPDLSVSFLRQYLKYYSDYYQLRMTDEWIYSFLNGANLLKGSLPQHLFRSFKFIQVMQRAMMNSLPSYTAIVKDSKRYSKHIEMSVEEMVQEMQPELWTLLVSNYDTLNQQYDKMGDKEFREVLRQMIEYLKISQTKPSYLQRIIALNRDDIFRQANIFSLFYVLNEQNASYSCITQCQERITSLTLLGYLNIQSVQNATKLCHPWQQFGSLILKQTISAVLIQLNLLQGRQYTTVLQQQQQMVNKFANKLFYYMKPLVIDKEYLLSKFPFVKVMRNFADKLPSPPSIVFLLEQFLIQNKMKSVFDSGLITSNMYKSNAFYQAHIIQQYGQMASQYEPQFVHYMYQIFIQILELKHRNSSILQQQLQILQNGDSSFFGLANKDLTLNFKMYFVFIIGQYLSQEFMKQNTSAVQSARAIKKNQSSLSIEYHESDGSESGNEQQEVETQEWFQGFTRQAILSCKVPLIEISLNCNSSSNSYNGIVAFLSLISQYKVMQAEQFKIAMQQMGKTDVELEQSDDQEEQSQYSKGSKISASVNSMSIASSLNGSNLGDKMVKYDTIRCAMLSSQQQLYLNNIRHDRKIILDVQNIVNLIQSYTNKKQRQHKKQQTQMNADLMQYIRNFVFEIQALQVLDDDAIEYLVLVQIIRFSILMSLGIKPYLAFNTTAFTKANIQYKYNVQSLFVGICLQSMLQQYYQSSKLQCGPISTDSSIIGFSSLLHARLQQYMQLVNDQGVLMNDVLSGNQFPDLTDQSAQFMQEPYDVILVLPKSVLTKQSSRGVSLENTIISSFINNSYMSVLFDKNEVKTILRLLSVHLNLNTELPASTLYTFLSLSYTVLMVNDLQKPVSEVYVDRTEPQIDCNEMQIFNQVPNILEDCVNLLQQEPSSAENQFLQYNFVKYQFQDLKSLFAISGCYIPDDSSIFATHQNGYGSSVQQYCFITVNIYSQIKRLIKRSCPNFVEFTQLASNMINFITRSTASFFDTYNYIFLAFHYFEALASPAKRAAEMLKPEQFQQLSGSGDEPEVQNVVQHEIRQYQTGQVGKFVDFQFLPNLQKMASAEQLTEDFDVRMLSSTVTNQIMRNMLFTALEYLKIQFGGYQQCAQSCCIDGIIICCYIVFYQSGILGDAEIFDYLQRAKFCRTFGNCQRCVQNVSRGMELSEMSHINLLLVYLVASCQEIGICVDLDNATTNNIRRARIQFQKFQKQQHTPANPLICMNYQNSNQCFMRYIHALGGFAFPITPLMHYMQTPIVANDPYYGLLYNLCVLAQVLAKTTFIIDQKLIMLAACLLEMLKHQDSQEGEYLRLIQQTVYNNKSFTSAQYQEIYKKIIILDLSMNAKDFQQQFARTLSLSDNTLIFANFSKQANANNLVVLRKFLQLRARKIIQKRQSIYIGQQMTVTNQSLHKYKIIIGCEVSELYEMLEISQMSGQDFIDQFDILIPPQEETKHQQIYVTTQYLLRAVFGNQQTTRYITERQLYAISHTTTLLAQFRDVSATYFKKYVLKLEEGESTELGYNDLQQQLNDKICNAKAIIQEALANPGFYVRDRAQTQDLTQFCHVLGQLTSAAQMIDSQMQVFQQVEDQAESRAEATNRPLPPYASELLAELQCTYTVQTAGADSCLQFATGLQFVSDLFKNLAQTNLQFISFLNSDFVLNICAMIEQKREQLRTEASQYIAHLYDKNTGDTQGVNLLVRYPIEVALSNNKNIILRFFVKIVLPQILQLAISITRHRDQFPLYVALNLVMFSFLQEQFCVQDIANIQCFIQHFMLSVPLNTEQELDYQFAALLKSIFSENNQFYCKLHETQLVQRLKDHMPPIVQLSAELQAAWVRVSSLSFNSIINETLGWFLKYHSVFIQIAKCKNVFAAIVLFWYHNCDSFANIAGKINFNAVGQLQQTPEVVEEEAQENEEADEDNDAEERMRQLQLQCNERISALLCAQLRDECLTSLPKALQTPNPDVLFAVTLLSNALQPQLLDSNIELYLHLMHGTLGAQGILSYDAISQTVVPNAARCNTGVLRQCTLSPYAERQRIMSKFWADMSRSYQLALNLLEPDQYSQRIGHKPFISVQLFQLAEILYGIQADYNKFIHQVHRLMASEDYDPQKHYAYVSRLGPPPDSVILLFYDECIDIASIIKFVFYNCDLPIFQNVMLKFVAHFAHEINKDQIFVLNVDVDAPDDVELLLNYFVTKSTIYQYQLAMPVIITVPISASRTYDIDFLATHIGQIIQLTQPYICYVQQPRTLEASFRYVVSLLMMQQFENQQQKYSLMPKMQISAIQYLVAVAIARLEFNIHDNEIRQALSSFAKIGEKSLFEAHDSFLAANIQRIMKNIDGNSPVVTILQHFFPGTVKSKIARQAFEESSDESFQADNAELETADQFEVEEQQNAEDEDVENWSDWDDASDSGEDEAEEENQLAIATENAEQNVFSNIILQLNLFESPINVLSIINLEQLNQAFTKDMRHKQRKIVVKTHDNQIALLAAMFKQKDSLYELFGNVFAQIDSTARDAKTVLRRFFNSTAVRGAAFEKLVRGREEYPKLLESYLALLANALNKGAEMAQTQPQLLFQNLVSKQVNLELNAICGYRTFGIFQNKWIFSTEAFRNVLSEMMVFLKFKEAFLRGASMEKLKVIITVEPQQYFPVVEGRVILFGPKTGALQAQGQDNQQQLPEIHHTIFKQVFLHNAAYDSVLRQLVNQSPESRSGYASLLDLYVYVAESDEEICNCALAGYQRVDFRVRGVKHGDAFLRVGEHFVNGDVWVGLE